jgi:hypothetical protein
VIFGGQPVDVYGLNKQRSRNAPPAGANLTFDGHATIFLGD